ncbi:hypothetical protein SEA_GOCRAZY_30 [Arthrobacter phage GoCrazy]|uniref:Uncharacterized protein n=4 Tax=Mudcatvirus TaxID=1982088 RepID=A0AAE7VH27_9CAUD|nr:hypothetical protein BI184_gp30 [Arthrobacter phage Mudcat]YP_009603122.1 hypothetical protein FDH65_gp33 [Arthrobacter phage Circum]YP_010666712.1 hypothetical protein PQB81_gp033 [Arthrobacter phage Kardesai]YP_010666908.1 hypothetical protein PQB83_gp30 [Arthrobacter phage KeaneyLin]QXO13529.1 hypothetical protein SEA_GOCRAZY_30 [Arthrobacter phage GoCrazy]WBF79077.1 hypothetical protein SEA_HANKLY_31 [Arthrobacter phage Hankly]ALY08718.1 hypothetical protein CIRCUM_33 [Arthrobacter pha
MKLEEEYKDLSERYHTLNKQEMNRLLDIRLDIPDRKRHEILTEIGASFPEVYRLRAKFKGVEDEN